MKKLIVVLAVLMFAVPALAGDWSFYGSQRIGTWYTEREYPGNSSAYGGSDDVCFSTGPHSCAITPLIA